MTTTILKHPFDSSTWQDTPTTARGKAPRLVISNAGGALKEAWLFFGSMPTPGVYVTTATLICFARSTWGAQTITARRVTQPWKEKTLTYRTRPNTTATGASTTSPGALADNDRIDIDVTSIVRDALLGTGAPFYGFRLTTSGSGEYAIRSSEDPDPQLRPRLRIEFSKLPVAVSDLVPGDGSVVATNTPVLRWTYYDLEGDEQAAYQVQVDDAAGFTSPTLDTGWVTSSDPEHDLGA